ncbi:MAG: hypothetical protein F6K30_11850 [Cyanothece sp. SIO2G6]|nr:hypothetical protein [Cyanothece sp. SIO2G6]
MAGFSFVGNPEDHSDLLPSIGLFDGAEAIAVFRQQFLSNFSAFLSGSGYQ